MPVTEIATLKLVPPHHWNSPETQAFFGDVAAQQAAWSSYPLHYFQDASDAQTVYILTGWASVAAHFEWIESAQNQALLERSKGLIEVVDLQHARLHVELDEAHLVILEQWPKRSDEEPGNGSMVRGAIGLVEEKPDEVCSVKALWKAEDAVHEGENVHAPDRRTIRLKRLFLHSHAIA
ncbi:hypothetical protein OH77DRAFT_63240 [Trametes cingulata]|nr:hypothetical protein OH77DRAFT_63240 [Trametes cingulata]